jgi:hypothetical protein
LQLVVLRAQRASLKEAHWKRQARQVDEQIALIEAGASPACNGCTVSAPALISRGMR